MFAPMLAEQLRAEGFDGFRGRGETQARCLMCCAAGSSSRLGTPAG
jgi:hypothetical protein